MPTQITNLANLESDKPTKVLSVGIIGCGRIAEHHLRFIGRTQGARVIALADSNLPNAQRFAEQYRVEKTYTSHLEMLDSHALDVVHILTPPEFHYAQAIDAIDCGVHLLLEKPCTILAHELEDLYHRAEAKGVLLCPDFIQLFNPIFLQAVTVVDSGELGNVIHINSHLSVDLNTPEVTESMGLPWRFTLPGGILHDNITHPIYMTLRWLGEPQNVAVYSQSHGVLPQGLTDHLTVMLKGEKCTGAIVMSTLIRPEPYSIQIFCERGNVLVDYDSSTVLVTRNNKLPRSIRRASANFAQTFKLFGAGIDNVIRFARGKLVPFAGLQNLIPRFYDCIRNNSTAPIAKELAIAVARTEAKIFLQAGKLQLKTQNRAATQK